MAVVGLALWLFVKDSSRENDLFVVFQEHLLEVNPESQVLNAALDFCELVSGVVRAILLARFYRNMERLLVVAISVTPREVNPLTLLEPLSVS